MGDLTQPERAMYEVYQPRDAVESAIHSATLTGAAGLFLAAAQNTMARENFGAFGVFTKFGGTIALFASMGFTYRFVATASANLRQKSDPYNDALGGFFAGALVGLRKRSMPSTLGNGVALGAALAGVQLAGGLFQNLNANEDDEKQLSKEEFRKRFRRPVNELINELGEGRGIYGPGYDERRAERIKQAYGIDVPIYPRSTSSSPPSS